MAPRSRHFVTRRMLMWAIAFCLLWFALPVSTSAQVKEEKSEAHIREVAAQHLKQYEQSILPLMKQACFDCHSGAEVEGNFRADKLDPDLIRGKDIAWWLEVYAVLSKGEMPPKDSSDLSAAERTRFVNWLSSSIQAAEKLRKDEGSHSSFRRLTRYEYNYALQDLLGAPWEFAADLPDEAVAEDGFENEAHALRMSVKQIETYHQLARRALRRVTVRGEKPPVLHWSISMKQAFDREAGWLKGNEAARKKQMQASANRSHYLSAATGDRLRTSWNYRGAKYSFKHRDDPAPLPDAGSHYAVVQPGSREAVKIELDDKLPDRGYMRVRIRASRAEDAGEVVPALQLSFGYQATNEGRSVERLSRQETQITAAYGKPEIYEWRIPLSEIQHRNTYRNKSRLGSFPNPSEFIQFANVTLRPDGPGNPAVLIEHVEVATPVYEQWPPQTHRHVFIESEHALDESRYAREIIASFISRAWRRQPTPDEIDRKLQLFQALHSRNDDFQDAVLEVLATVLTSPKFLYVLPSSADTAEKDQLTQHELATRLSLLLWCSVPDSQLLSLASAGRLSDEKVLQQQVDRMLADPRAQRFSRHFVTQWLKMQPLEYLRPGSPAGMDQALLESMKQEPIAFFADMLRRDASVLRVIDSDYLVINERLARHYGVADVRGNHFRRVTLPAADKRGGVLTQAGLLTMNSDGKDSHPVKRGVWLLTNLLNDPPPPPPPAVPVIDVSDPEIAKLTLKQRIEDHRNQAACLSCHQKIDPWGIAFENYDALGRWRSQTAGKEIDATSTLPDNTQLSGMQGLKQHLLQNRHEQFVRATVEKMAAFALGRRLGFADRAGLHEITGRVRESGDGAATMVKCLVTSELFQKR